MTKTSDSVACSICQSNNATAHRDDVGCRITCPDCRCIVDDDTDLPGLQLPMESLMILVEWYPNSKDGVLDTDDVLDSCEGYKLEPNNPILTRVQKLKDLGVNNFQAMEGE